MRRGAAPTQTEIVDSWRTIINDVHRNHKLVLSDKLFESPEWTLTPKDFYEKLTGGDGKTDFPSFFYTKLVEHDLLGKFAEAYAATKELLLKSN